uniref:Uncharacterized protein n=1 Tax=Moorena producens (strain JHB) TaxID=1454205 RepID=A0A1D9G6U8_MOOP1
MLLAWACCWHGHLGGTGMLLAWASWWHGHVGGMGILPVSFLGRAFPTKCEEVENEGKPPLKHH